MQVLPLCCKVGEVLLVKGPAAVKALDEGWSSLGAPLKPGIPVTIRSNKVLPIETSRSNTPIIAYIGSKGNYQVGRGEFGIRIWNIVKDRVVFSGNSYMKVMLVGASGLGKSTLSTFLINTALSHNLRIGIVDGDVGQGDLAPPGCIGGSLVKTQIFDLRDLRGGYFSFIGATSPQRIENLVIEGIKQIQMKIEYNDLNLCIVNTDGFVSDKGFDYKVWLARELNPEFIICLRRSEEDPLLKRMLKEFGWMKVIPAKGTVLVAKNPFERSQRRLSQYQRFLRNSRRIRTYLQRVTISLLGNRFFENDHSMETRLYMKAFVKRDNLGNRLILQPGLQDNMAVSLDGIRTICLGSLEGMFVGLGSSEVMGFGLIEKSYGRGVLEISTPVRRMFDTLHLSVIQLSHDLRFERLIPLF